MRTAADFDNFRKRTRRELEDARQGGPRGPAEGAPARLRQPRARHPERAASDRREGRGRRARDGRSEFVETLGREGIARVPTVGQPFDPERARGDPAGGDRRPRRRARSWPRCSPATCRASGSMRAAMVVVAKPKARRRRAETPANGDELTRREGRMGKVIGIDLGTTNSCVAVVETTARPASSTCASSRTRKARGRRRRSSASRRAASGSSGRRRSARR